MRVIVLDTETTGLDPEDGHRIVEIGAVEMRNYSRTGEVYHQYINPERDMPAEAEAIHGLSAAFLSGFPTFGAIAVDLMRFLGDSALVIHNASFDMKFLNHELTQAGHASLPLDTVTDTLALARRKFPGASVSLDALCRRFGVDNSSRDKHGALLDSELLADVYLELIGGRQTDLGLATVGAKSGQHASATVWTPGKRPNRLPARLTTAEESAHDAMIQDMGEAAIWARLREAGTAKH